MSGRNFEIPPQPTLFDGPTKVTGAVVLAGELVGVLAYAAANPYPEELRVGNPNILSADNKSAEAIAYQSAVAKADIPRETPLGLSGVGEAGIGIAFAAAVALAGNGLRRIRRNYLINKADAHKQAPAS
jgi:hypothetical protein